MLAARRENLQGELPKIHCDPSEQLSLMGGMNRYDVYCPRPMPLILCFIVNLVCLTMVVKLHDRGCLIGFISQLKG